MVFMGSMPKSGHPLSRLLPQFPGQISRKLEEGFSINTAEEFLGWAITQNLASIAQTLGVARPLLERAMQAAKEAVDPAFLRELESPRRSYSTGAEVDDSFVLPPELAQHLQRG